MSDVITDESKTNTIDDTASRPSDEEIISYVRHKYPDGDPIVFIYACISCPLPNDLIPDSVDLLNYYITHIIGDAEASRAFEEFLVTHRNNKANQLASVIYSQDPYTDVESPIAASVIEEENDDEDNNKGEGGEEDQDPIAAKIKALQANVAARLAEIKQHLQENEEQQVQVSSMLSRRPTGHNVIDHNDIKQKAQTIHAINKKADETIANTNVTQEYRHTLSKLTANLGI